ncbi:MAG: diphthine--ammonia ligase [Candidatus Omnitrophica bacterium]|nr:diphthine--ammonia ligase [Candidatus Omnitrophota bacterium]
MKKGLIKQDHELAADLALVDQKRAALTAAVRVKGRIVRPPLKMAVGWSGGKDSMALVQAVAALPGVQMFLFNIQDKLMRYSIAAPFNPALIRMQASCLGLTIKSAGLEGDYRAGLDRLLRRYVREGVDALGMGYIASRGQRDLVHDLASRHGLFCFEPFVGRSHGALIRERLASGIQAIIVGIDPRVLDESWLGRTVDKAFVDNLKLCRGASLCGENNEYQTLVVDGPLFKKKIEIISGRMIKVRGRAYLYVDRARVVNKKVYSSQPTIVK